MPLPSRPRPQCAMRFAYRSPTFVPEEPQIAAKSGSPIPAFGIEFMIADPGPIENRGARCRFRAAAARGLWRGAAGASISSNRPAGLMDPFFASRHGTVVVVHWGPPFGSSAAVTAGKKTRMKKPAIDDILRLGAKALEEQRATDAERLARDALARDSRHPGALHLLGVALLAQKRAREAVAPLEQAARERTSSR